MCVKRNDFALIVVGGLMLNDTAIVCASPGYFYKDAVGTLI